MRPLYYAVLLTAYVLFGTSLLALIDYAKTH